LQTEGEKDEIPYDMGLSGANFQKSYQQVLNKKIH
jgi:hypothetical protein